MRALKNVLVKTTCLILLCCLTFSATSQSSTEINKFETRLNHKLRLYTAPLDLINPMGNSYQVTFGKSFWEKGEVQISIAQRLGKGDPYYIENLISIFSDITANYRKGTSVGLEYQHVIKRNKILDLYLGIEGRVWQDHIYVQNNVTIFLLSYRNQEIERTTMAYNMKMGLKFFILENFIIDIYGGVGRIRQSESVSANVLERLYLPMNIKVGYQF